MVYYLQHRWPKSLSFDLYFFKDCTSYRLTTTFRRDSFILNVVLRPSYISQSGLLTFNSKLLTIFLREAKTLVFGLSGSAYSNYPQLPSPVNCH